MDAIDLLRAQALTKRNAAIQAARREYHAALKEINALASKLNLKPTGRPRKRLPAGDPNLKATAVAREILREGKPMTIVELTIEVQRRGCRTLDDPRAVAHAIRWSEMGLTLIKVQLFPLSPAKIIAPRPVAST